MENDKVEVMYLRCLECGTDVPVAANGHMIRYDLNCFCPDKDCEDIYASKL